MRSRPLTSAVLADHRGGFDSNAAILRRFSVAAAVAHRPLASGPHRNPGTTAAPALSWPGRDGNQRAEGCLGHAPAGNGPILAEACRRSCRLCDRPAGDPFGAEPRRPCRLFERGGVADLQRARSRSGGGLSAAGKRSMAVSVRFGLHGRGFDDTFRCPGDHGVRARRGAAGGAIEMGRPRRPDAAGPRAADPARSSDDLTFRSQERV
jgi:hypothetical protein